MVVSIEPDVVDLTSTIVGVESIIGFFGAVLF